MGLTVAFYLDCDDDVLNACAERMIASVREHMPQADIVHLTMDAEKDKPFGWRRNAAQSTVEGDAIFVDVDTVFRADVSDVFARDFDIAVCPDMRPGTEGTRFDGGVAFSRSPQAWRDLAEHLGALDFKREGADWRPLMEGYTAFLEQRKYRTLVLPAAIYCRVPDSPDDDLAGAKIVHYRGPRKAWMLQ